MKPKMRLSPITASIQGMKGYSGPTAIITRALTIMIRRAPNRSINAPPWIENNTDSNARDPIASPIRNGGAPSSIAQSGTATVVMGTTASAKNPAIYILA